uniref:RNA-directed RNA polymerase catalytic subunit n=1 Tax=Ganwon-do orthomyxo-like virus TaxID=2789609 RepID=A0A7T1GW47_9ORTO|nr:hypothetical protein [Ganwon-do orthomyxo-like virus]
MATNNPGFNQLKKEYDKRSTPINIFLASSLLKKPKDYYQEVDEENKKKQVMLTVKYVDKDNKIPGLLSNLGLASVSFLYQYVNTPPMRLGNPFPMAAESVIRACEFNMLPNNGLPGTTWEPDWKTGKINLDKFPRSYWTRKDGKFNTTQETHNNWDPVTLRGMCKDFVNENQNLLDKCAYNTVELLIRTNSDVLTAGKQTWCPIEERSTESVNAYKAVSEIFRANIKAHSYNCLQWIRYIHEMFELEELKFETSSYVTFEEFKRKTIEEAESLGKRPRQLKDKGMKYRWESHVELTSKEEIRERWFRYLTSFYHFPKDAERGKLKPRAVVSANIMFRMYLYIGEKFHLELNKKHKSGTISVGGDRKKAKIASMMSLISNDNGIQFTEDNTKHNECVQPEALALMNYYLLSDEFRSRTSEKDTYPEHRKILRDIIVQSCYLLTQKRLYKGIGTNAMNTEGTAKCRLEWDPIFKEFMAEGTRKWFDKLEKFCLHDGDYVKSPFGMLMGMHNAMSSTLGIIATGYKTTIFEEVGTLRSSDDSMTKFSTKEGMSSTFSLIESNRKNLKRVGFNISPQKSRGYIPGVGEYNSWYQETVILAQFGVETAALRPQGKSPGTDLQFIASQAHNINLRMGMNSVGVQAFLFLGVDGVKRLWKIKRYQDNEFEWPGQILVTADGGIAPWDCTTASYEETAMKKRVIMLAKDEERREKWLDYINKVRSTVTPFSGCYHTVYSFSIELSQMVEMYDLYPRNVFSTGRRGNATLRSRLTKRDVENEAAASNICEVLKLVIPESVLNPPTMTKKISEYIQEDIDNRFYYLLSKGLIDDEVLSLYTRVRESLNDDC